MILTPKILARLVALVVLAVLLQVTFFSRVALFHVSPDVLPAVIASLGLLGGSMSGAVAGFSAGLLLDCLLIAPLGGSSLVLMATGYLAGTFRERFEITSRFLPPLLIAAFTLFAELGFGAVELMLGVDSTVSALIVKDMLVKTVFAFFLGWPIYLGVKRLLAPAIVEDPEGRRSRRPTMLGA
jgi:rod shape-determining protein MreD